MLDVLQHTCLHGLEGMHAQLQVLTRMLRPSKKCGVVDSTLQAGNKMAGMELQSTGTMMMQTVLMEPQAALGRMAWPLNKSAYPRLRPISWELSASCPAGLSMATER